MSRITEDPEAHVCTIPTDAPESDGTLAWKETTMVVVLLRCGGAEGIGYTYGNEAIGKVILTGLGSVAVPVVLRPSC